MYLNRLLNVINIETIGRKKLCLSFKKNLNINLEEIINEIAKKIMLIGIAEAKKNVPNRKDILPVNKK